MKTLQAEMLKEGRTKSKIRILEDYPPLKKGTEIRVLNNKILYL
jgi:hypothetical protein